MWKGFSQKFVALAFCKLQSTFPTFLNCKYCVKTDSKFRFNDAV